MSNTALLTLVKFAAKQAEKLFRAQGQILPMYHAVTASGQNLIFNLPSGDKDESVAVIKQQFRERDVEYYVFIDEAWFLDIHPGRLDLAEIDRDGLRNHPDRREIVAVIGEHRDGAMITARRYILRPEHGKPSLSPLKLDDMEGVTSRGRMVGLLQR